MNYKYLFILFNYINIFNQNAWVYAKASKQTEIGLNITRILNSFFDGKYDKRVRPNYAGPPVEVAVSMYIISISSISEVQMDFTSDFYFRQGWRDTRLSFERTPAIDALFVGAEVSDRIWVPDTFFANEKSAQFHKATTPNTFIRITYTGEVLRSIRLTVTTSCAMNLKYFPMDKQTCTLEIESYGYSMADIMYKWGKGKGSVGMSEQVQLPQFTVRGLKQHTKAEILSTGNYSRLVCEIEFVRSMGYYLIQIYIPASLIVIISWVSFWLHRNASPARVQLGVTTVLTMTTLMSSTNAALPKVSYVKSIDIFLGTCFTMVFASLLEYATVGYMGKRIAMRKTRSQQLAKMAAIENKKKSMDTNLEPRSSIYPIQSSPFNPCIPRPRNISGMPDIRYRMVETKTLSRPSVDYNPKKKVSIVAEPSEPEEPATPGSPPATLPLLGSRNPNTLFGVCPSDIDKYSRVVFPVCFLCFNLMYWVIYMHISEFLITDEQGAN